MSSQGCLNRHFSRFEITNFSDHNDIGILAKKGPQAAGKIKPYGAVHLHLVKPGLDHLDWILDGADVYFRLGQMF